MTRQRTRTPHAIWFQTIPGYEASISVVNDLYRYEIYETSTVRRICMASHGTLIQAKDAVMAVFLKAVKGEL